MCGIDAMTRKTAQIPMLHDAYHNTFRGGRVLLTRGALSLPHTARSHFWKGCRHLDDFRVRNAPFGKHGFGSRV